MKLNNFREKWIGSSEGNLEKIFRLIRALGRCIVFIDEADQTLGRRESGTGDSGLSGRLYSMIAQEMAATANRGKVVWILASSRPDLIEVDLKRPGRIDLKVPILPTTTREESAALVAALAHRYELEISTAEMKQIEPYIPLLLTPGAAEALVVKAYRVARTEQANGAVALQRVHRELSEPCAAGRAQQADASGCARSDGSLFVPEALRHLATEAEAAGRGTTDLREVPDVPASQSLQEMSSGPRRSSAR